MGHCESEGGNPKELEIVEDRRAMQKELEEDIKKYIDGGGRVKPPPPQMTIDELKEECRMLYPKSSRKGTNTTAKGYDWSTSSRREFKGRTDG